MVGEISILMLYTIMIEVIWKKYNNFYVNIAFSPRYTE